MRGELADGMRGARRLAQESFSRGSLDNVTVLVIDLRNAKWNIEEYEDSLLLVNSLTDSKLWILHYALICFIARASSLDFTWSTDQLSLAGQVTSHRIGFDRRPSASSPPSRSTLPHRHQGGNSRSSSQTLPYKQMSSSNFLDTGNYRITVSWMKR